MEKLGLRQKRVLKLKRRNINIGESRLKKDYIILYANKNHRVTEEQIKTIKTDLTIPKGLIGGKLIKNYKIKITMVPNKILTNKGILVRMGKGKGKIKTYVKYLTVGTICIELISLPLNNISKNIIEKILKKFISKFTFLSYKFLI